MRTKLLASLSSLLILLSLLAFVNKLDAAPRKTSFYKSFFIEGGVVQYYVKPILLEEKGKREKLLVDITCRLKNDSIQTATVNLSLLSADKIPFSKIKEIHVNGDLVLTYDQLYNEPHKKKGYELRITTNVSPSTAASFSGSTSVLIVTADGQQWLFTALAKKSRKSLEKTQQLLR